MRCEDPWSLYKWGFSEVLKIDTGTRLFISPTRSTCPNPKGVPRYLLVFWSGLFALFTIGPFDFRFQRLLRARTAKPHLLLNTLFFVRPGSGCATPAAGWILAGFAYKATLIGTFPSFFPHISDHLVYCKPHHKQALLWLFASKPSFRVSLLFLSHWLSISMITFLSFLCSVLDKFWAFNTSPCSWTHDSCIKWYVLDPNPYGIQAGTLPKHKNPYFFIAMT